MAKLKTVRLELIELVSDRLQYKPYTARLGSPTDGPIVYVDVDINADLVKEGGLDDDKIVITEHGLAAVMGKIADAIEDMHEEVKKRYSK